MNKISIDEICGSLLTYEQEVNQIDEEEKKKIIEKKKIALKMSSKDEELYDNSCEDEDAEMTMLVRRYKKLAFQSDQWMEEKTFGEIDFGMIHQETIKLLVIVVSSLDI